MSTQRIVLVFFVFFLGLYAAVLAVFNMLKPGSRSSRVRGLSRGMGGMNGVCVGADSLPPALFYVWDASGRLQSCHGESETQDKRPLLVHGVV